MARSRFAHEAPFVFYHAALALVNSADVSGAMQAEAMIAAQAALNVVYSFDGEPDRETISVLQTLLHE